MIPGDAEPFPFLERQCGVFEYEGRASQAVRRLKYGARTGLHLPMSELMREAFDAYFEHRIDAIVPVPIHWTRRCARGFNQSELLASALPDEFLHPEMLRRFRATKAQASLNRAHRLQSLTDAFRALPSVRGKRVLLVDDVVTTGATMEACTRALIREGASEVSALTFAAVPAPGRSDRPDQDSGALPGSLAR